MQLCHKNDAFIDRPENGAVTLSDEEGNVLWTFPLSWSDADILHALAFANKAFECGRQAGRLEVQHAMRVALGVNKVLP